MKIYFKFFIIIFATSTAFICNIQKVHAIRTPSENVFCAKGNGICGTGPEGQIAEGILTY